MLQGISLPIHAGVFMHGSHWPESSGRITAHMVGCAMPTTFVDHYLLWMWLFIYEDSGLLRMVKSGLSLRPTMFQMGSTLVALASSKES